MEYSYPLNPDWTNAEISTVINFFETVERAYEKGVNVEEVKEKYRAFKEVVPSIGEEKRLGKEFEQVSGYSPYQVIQNIKNASTSTIKMKP